MPAGESGHSVEIMARSSAEFLKREPFVKRRKPDSASAFNIPLDDGFDVIPF
jgi:hypothetical protein